MIRNEPLLQASNLKLKTAVNYLDYSVGSMFDLQILAAASLEDKLEANLIQGGKLADVNKERSKAGLHEIGINQNEKIVADDWKELIRSNEGVVVVFLNGWRRMKVNQVIESSIEATVERFEFIKVDKLQGVKGDYLFIYSEDATTKKKTSKKAGKAAKKTEEEPKEEPQTEEN